MFLIIIGLISMHISMHFYQNTPNDIYYEVIYLILQYESSKHYFKNT
jgi:hypothetical protein